MPADFPIYVGHEIKLICYFYDDNDALVTPSTTRLIVQKPNREEVTFTTASSPAITFPSVGLARLLYTTDMAGTHKLRWEATGNVKVPDEDYFVVERQQAGG